MSSELKLKVFSKRVEMIVHKLSLEMRKMRMILGIDIDEDTLVNVTVGIPWSMSHCHYVTVYLLLFVLLET